MKGHVREVDGLRALAVFAVFLTHWGPPFFETTVHTGSMGVRAFFVLSGFLITDILLRARDRIDAGGGRLSELGTFYARRTLRIFPAYYAAIFAGAALGLGVTAESLGWHVLYLSNFYNTAVNGWPHPVGHLWSLACEEQFYLLWPLVIFTAPRRHLRKIMWGLVALGPVWRISTSLAGLGAGESTLLPAAADALALGGLLAYGARDGLPSPKRMMVVAAIGLLLVLAALPARQSVPVVFAAIYPPGVAMVAWASLAAILRWRGHKSLAPLRWWPVAALGTISYGLYLYHPFVAELIGLFVPETLHRAPRFALNLVATVAVAALSWKCLEDPLNKLKDRFPYGRRWGRREASA